MDGLSKLAGKVFLNRFLVGGFVLLVVAVTLTLDVMGLVHPCPYCRTERAALGILSLILLFNLHRALFWRYFAALAGFYGLMVGVMQNFNHVKKINAGEFDWPALTFDHPFILSGLAVTALVWLLFIILGLAEAPARAR
ncbi:MAG: disulfide bond formation protein B [Parvularculaceae bacterium]|nr:disulfide bond formation protein B [Parvularculaceae bacterium]